MHVSQRTRTAHGRIQGIGGDRLAIGKTQPRDGGAIGVQDLHPRLAAGRIDVEGHLSSVQRDERGSQPAAASPGFLRYVAIALHLHQPDGAIAIDLVAILVAAVIQVHIVAHFGDVGNPGDSVVPVIGVAAGLEEHVRMPIAMPRLAIRAPGQHRVPRPVDVVGPFIGRTFLGCRHPRRGQIVSRNGQHRDQVFAAADDVAGDVELRDAGVPRVGTPNHVTWRPSGVEGGAGRVAIAAHEAQVMPLAFQVRPGMRLVPAVQQAIPLPLFVPIGLPELSIVALYHRVTGIGSPLESILAAVGISLPRRIARFFLPAVNGQIRAIGIYHEARLTLVALRGHIGAEIALVQGRRPTLPVRTGSIV